MPAFDAGSLREPGHGRLDDTVAIAHRQHRHPHDLDRWRVVPDGGVEDRREEFGVRRHARPVCYDGLRSVNEQRATLRRALPARQSAVCVLHHEPVRTASSMASGCLRRVRPGRGRPLRRPTAWCRGSRRSARARGRRRARHARSEPGDVLGNGQRREAGVRPVELHVSASCASRSSSSEEVVGDDAGGRVAVPRRARRVRR